MAITNLVGNGQLRTGRAELDVPCLGVTSTFALPLVGPNYHKNVMQEIDSQKLYRPTTAQVFSLVDLALQNPKEMHCAEILDRFKQRYLWTSTENLSFPEGVLVYDNVDGKMPQTSEGLMQLVSAGDKRVRLVNSGFETGCMSISKFLEHPFVLAQIGESMVEIVERVAKACHKREAYVFGLGKTGSDTNRKTAVCSRRGGGGLVLGGGSGGDDGGYASGVK